MRLSPGIIIEKNPFLKKIVEELLNNSPKTKKNFDKIKTCICNSMHIPLPRNSEILDCIPVTEKSKFIQILKLKPVRTVSGVTIVTVMVKPHQCPHGRCLYCPGGVQQGTPAAYTGHEPACLRGIQYSYDPYLQVKSRLDQLRNIGHDIDKVEQIILGGNFTFLPEDYQDYFIKNCLDAVNDFHSQSLTEAKKSAENAAIKNSGITVETRPDLCGEKHVDKLLDLGVTRVELGVQTIYDDVYRLVNRGHSVEDVSKAHRISKDAGMTVLAHLMTNLPGSDLQKDIEMFKQIYADENFKPDCIKIYPTLVLEGTKLYELWKKGEYAPYPEEETIKLIIEAKKITPPWVRIQRIQRDIPSKLIAAGLKSNNLREIVHKRMLEQGIRCECIRCREVGHIKLRFGNEPNNDNIKLKKIKYSASKGEEIFLSFEDIAQNILIGLLRMRYPSNNVHRKEISDSKTLIVRELHIFGPIVPVGNKPISEWQHQGFGSLLLTEAEKIAIEEYNARKIMILSALGVKGYYKRFGFKVDGPYVSKFLK